jgi:NADH dehydrogenase
MRAHELVDVKARRRGVGGPGRTRVTAADGTTFTGDYLILAAGRGRTSSTPPAPTSTRSRCTRSNDAERLRTRVFAAFDAADRDPSLVDRGVIRFVVVGGGPTGVEVAGAWPS